MQLRVGLGLAAIGRPAYITSGRDADLGTHRAPDALRARAHALLDAAYTAGVRYLDVARSYGKAEEFLAGWLAAHPEATDVLVGSKWGYRYVGEWRMDAPVHEVKDHSPAAFVEQLAATRALLGDRLAVYHVHSATLETGALTDPVLHRVLAGLRDQGVRIGISTSGPAQGAALLRALEVIVDGSPLFTSFQSTWNLLEPSAAPVLAAAASAGARVIIKEAVANGLLAPGAPDSEATRPAAVGRVLGLAEQLGVTVDQVAIAAAAAQPWAWQVLSGAVTPAQLASNLAAARLTVTEEQIADLIGTPQPAADYWAARSARRWA